MFVYYLKKKKSDFFFKYIVNFHIFSLNDQMQGIAENYTCYGGSLGKISGYFVSSFLAFDICVNRIKVYKFIIISSNENYLRGIEIL